MKELNIILLFTSHAIYSKTVKIVILNTDRYGRFIANVIYDNNIDLGRELVKNGLAWNYIKYSTDEKLIYLQEKAKKDKVGLWSDQNCVPPWKWRKSKKPKLLN